MAQLINPADQPLVKMTILRNVTVEAIQRPLMKIAQQEGFQLDVKFGGFDTALQDSLAAGHTLSEETDIVVLLLSIKALSVLICDRFSELSDSEISTEVDRIKNYFHSVIIAAQRSAPAAKIFVHNLETFSWPLHRVSQTLVYTSQNSAVIAVNKEIASIVSDTTNTYLIDNNLIHQQLGSDQYFDMRYWYHARAPYGQAALSRFSRRYIHLLSEIFGKSKKCLILDCDNTLWGGIVGEEGVQGISLDDHGAGAAFKSFQYLLASLSHSGVILALCSKNNSADVWRVFKDHPHMVLTRDDISSAQINWDNKAQNIVLIAKELNVGLDSCVFVDDNEFEVNLVATSLPEVKTVYMDKNNPSRYAQTLLETEYFSKLDVLVEDKQKSKFYSQQKLRTNSQLTSTIEDYIASLGMVIDISLAEVDDLKRIAQMSQKTNQFNLTTNRYTENDIARFHDDPQRKLFVLKVSDRFGDLGIVGFAICHSVEERLVDITDLALSCRALGRKVEHVFLTAILEFYHSQGFRTVRSKFIPTDKNSQVSSFYEGFEFMPMSSSRDQKDYEYCFKEMFEAFLIAGVEVNNYVKGK